MRILAPKGYASHAPFSGIIIDAEAAIVEIRAQPLEAGQAIADCSSQGRFAQIQADIVGMFGCNCKAVSGGRLVSGRPVMRR
jgi:hypothetical protein